MTIGSRLRLSLLAAASALVVGAVPAGAATVAPPPAAGDPAAVSDADLARGGWTGAKLPEGACSLMGSVKLDAHTTWATGFRISADDRGVDFTPTVYTHDDRQGAAWRELPLAPGSKGRANAIAGTSPRDVWVVGDNDLPGGRIQTQHWNGTSWQVVPAELSGDALGGGLLSVDAVSSDDVWAAGWAQVVDQRIPDPDGGPTQIVDHDEGIVRHWDGRTWTQMNLPKPYASWGLNAISASGPNDVWAVGNGYGDDDKPVALHYDGHTWQALPTPRFTGLWAEFNSVVANSPRDVWAVGRTVVDEKDRGHALVMHWDGRTWTQVQAPADAGKLTGVAAVPGGVVAVGSTLSRDSGYALRVTGTHAASLNFPATSEGTEYTPWSVAADGHEVRVSGAYGLAKQDVPMPMLLTTRV
ncbi:hypothetical protein [Yinghuangia seranimata]|uniref:hypothetical protein n=1 Tax=Yinghuangia seranimata TaxID=408067 RepID=UPI00248C2530|nr:hypothetical protein [Yinghuangia seranimata]MDI2128567.1 hypothetical protein [Yinghuangia seranimata]